MSKEKLPEFDERGCLPYGVYDPEIDDFKNIFVNTPRRKELFKNLQKFLKLCIDAKGIESIYIGGSFTTDKAEPGDIDLLVIFTNELLYSSDKLSESAEIITDFIRVRQEYEIEAFYAKLLEDDDPDDVKQYWSDMYNHMQGMRRNLFLNREKGIIDVKFKGAILFEKDDFSEVVGA